MRLVLILRSVVIEQIVRWFLPAKLETNSAHEVSIGRIARLLLGHYRTELPRSLVNRIDETWKTEEGVKAFATLLLKFSEIRNSVVHGGTLNQDQMDFIVPELTWYSQRPPITAETIYSLIETVLISMDRRGDPIAATLKPPQAA